MTTQKPSDFSKKLELRIKTCCVNVTLDFLNWYLTKYYELDLLKIKFSCSRILMNCSHVYALNKTVADREVTKDMKDLCSPMGTEMNSV